MTRNFRPRVFLCFYVVGAGRDLVSNYWVEPLTRSLRDDMGCEVIVPTNVNLGAAYGRTDSAWMREQRPRLSEALLRQFQEAHRDKPIDLFLSYFTSAQIERSALKEVRAKAPCVNFFCDNLHAFNLVEELAPEFTLNWVPERRACDTYRARGLPYIYLPMAACPSYHHPLDAVVEDIDVSFCGGFQLPRIELFGEAYRRGLEIEVFGPQTESFLRPKTPLSVLSSARSCLYWMKSHIGNCLRRGLAFDLYSHRMEFARLRNRHYPPRLLHAAVPDEDVNRLYARTKVSVGANRIWLPGTLSLLSTKWYAYPRLRDFEATMAGACFLTEYCEEHDELFDIGKEIEVYRDGEELVEKAQALLADHDRRARLRTNARKAAVAHHTWRHRLEKVFEEVGVSWRAPNTATTH